MRKNIISLFIIICSVLGLSSNSAYGVYGDPMDPYTPSSFNMYINPTSPHYRGLGTYESHSSDSPFNDEYYQKEYKEKVEVFCAAGVNNPERCNHYCDKLKSVSGAHVLCGAPSVQRKVQTYTEKVKIFCAPGVNKRDKCKKYCTQLGFSGKTHKYCNNSGSFKSNEYREKIQTFCASGMNNSKKCNKYCRRLADIGETHKECGSTPAEKIISKTRNKKIIANEDGTKTEVSIKSENNKETIVRITRNGSIETEKEIIEDIKKEDGEKELVTTEVTESREEITKLFFNKNDKKIKEEVEIIVTQKGEESVVKTEKGFDNNIVTELIIQEGQSEDKLQKVEHKLFNQALIATEELQNKHIQIVYNTEQPKDIQDVFFDKLNQELVINKNGGKKISLKGEGNILYSGGKEIGFNQGISINVKSGEIFVKVGDDDLIKWAMMPDQLSEKILKEGDLDRINNMQIISDNNSVKYIVQGVKRKKIFKLYPVEIQQNKIYNLDNGDLIKTQMDRKNLFLDKISF